MDVAVTNERHSRENRPLFVVGEGHKSKANSKRKCRQSGVALAHVFSYTKSRDNNWARRFRRLPTMAGLFPPVEKTIASRGDSTDRGSNEATLLTIVENDTYQFMVGRRARG